MKKEAPKENKTKAKASKVTEAKEEVEVKPETQTEENAMPRGTGRTPLPEVPTERFVVQAETRVTAALEALDRVKGLASPLNTWTEKQAEAIMAAIDAAVEEARESLSTPAGEKPKKKGFKL